MMESTETTVITPMITPSRVSPERSLFRRRAWREMLKSSDSRMASIGRGRLRRAGAFRLGGLLLLLRHPLDPVAVLDLAQGLEGPRDDLLAGLRALHHLDHQLAREPGLH